MKYFCISCILVDMLLAKFFIKIQKQVNQIFSSHSRELAALNYRESNTENGEL